MPEALGIDIGRVIIDGDKAREDTAFFLENYLLTPEMEGAFDAIARLVKERFRERTYLISKAGPRTQHKTMEWLAYHNFHDITGTRPGNVHYCLTRVGKAPLALKLGITHFIDDRAEALSHLSYVPVNHLYLFKPGAGEMEELEKYPTLIDKIRILHGWQEAIEELALKNMQ